jgi:hypothetical protein
MPCSSFGIHLWIQLVLACCVVVCSRSKHFYDESHFCVVLDQLCNNINLQSQVEFQQPICNFIFKNLLQPCLRTVGSLGLFRRPHPANLTSHECATCSATSMKLIGIRSFIQQNLVVMSKRAQSYHTELRKCQAFIGPVA